MQLSGLGPAPLLRAHGIAVALDAPAIGANLQDHLCYDHVYRARLPSLNQELGPWSGRVRAGLRYLLSRSGPLSLSVNQGGAFVRMRPESPSPDLQLYFSPLTYERTPPGVRALLKPDPFPGFCTSASPCKPTSRGEVALASADPHRAPLIRGNYLSTAQDVAELLAGARLLRRLAATPPLCDVIEAELKPGREVEADEALVADIRARAYSVFHPCGSCRMGPDPRSAVVDERLRVHGVESLRIADASIFPLITSGNTNAPTIMVAEKAADLMRADAADEPGSPIRNRRRILADDSSG
jgi:choline dehydrogenase